MNRPAHGPRPRGPQASAGMLASAWASAHRPRAGRFVRFWASGGAKFPEMCDSLLRITMNYHAKFDTTSYILDGEILNCTNTHTKLQKKNNQTVTDRSTRCLSACVDKKNWLHFLFFVKAATVKRQISKFYPQIQRTEASHHISVSGLP